MNMTTFEYARLGLTIARFASQMKEGISIDCNISMGGPNGTYIIVGLYTYPGKNPECLKSFYGCQYENLEDFLEEIFAFCLQNDLFKQPLDIKLID